MLGSSEDTHGVSSERSSELHLHEGEGAQKGTITLNKTETYVTIHMSDAHLLTVKGI